MRWLITLSILLPLPLVAQDNSNSETEVEVEALYDNFDKEQSKKKDQEQAKRAAVQEKKKEVNTLTDLVELAPFQDVAVIQRRFMPKTSRFEFSGSLGTSTNNPFFNNWGVVGKASYYFNEYWAVEAMYYWLNSSERGITENLRNDQSVETDSLVVPENYLGFAAKWSPIYGKIAWFNKTIIPFDLFFTLGGGLSQTGLEESETTLHMGAGQLFYLTKSFGVKWDLAINSYQAKVIERVTTNVYQENTKNHFDLFIAIGVAYFWPGATYR